MLLSSAGRWKRYILGPKPGLLELDADGWDGINS